jgi:hypothetical protein
MDANMILTWDSPLELKLRSLEMEADQDGARDDRWMEWMFRFEFDLYRSVKRHLRRLLARRRTSRHETVAQNRRSRQ